MSAFGRFLTEARIAQRSIDREIETPCSVHALQSNWSNVQQVQAAKYVTTTVVDRTM